MFPGSYSYNPGVVLDPITMTPMISGSSFTVNPLGVTAKPEQKVWQKMFIKDIPTQCTSQCMVKLLNEFGEVKNFKRSTNQRGQLLNFCIFDFETGEEILRLKRLFKNIRILDKNPELKISEATENFIKQWTAIQKDEWRKKLVAPGMNEAKQYATIQDYHERDDAKYRQRIEDRLRQINTQVKKYAMEKMREEEKKEHPREKQREKQRKRQQDELMRLFHEQEDDLLKRQRNKEKQYRKMRERERSNEKRKIKRLEKQLSISAQQEQKRAAKFLHPDRMKVVERQQMQDNAAILQQNPPLPQQQAPVVQQPKRVKAIAEQSFQIVQNHPTQDEQRNIIAFDDHDKATSNNHNRKEVRIQKMFKDYRQQDIHQQVQPSYELKLPELQEIEKEKQKQKQLKAKIAELEIVVPKDKAALFEYKIDWDRLAKSVVLDRSIRPWLQEQSEIYMGVVNQKFVALVEKRLFSQSKPQKIIKVMAQLIDYDAQQFVVKLWKTLVLQDLKLKNGLVK